MESYNELLQMAPSFFGMSMIPEDRWKEYGYALLTIAGSDGEVSEEEMDWLIIDAAIAIEVEEEVIDAWRDFDYAHGDLQAIFSDINTSGAVNYNKLLIYDAIRMSSADHDYSDDEREKVSEAASILKVRQEELISIEALVEMEMALDKMRLIIF
ncbi:MAG: TerB family tellurite resistance protein [Cyclobacteriaceae bacterium]